MKLAIDLNDALVEKLKAIAAKLGVPVEDLARAAVTDLVATESVEFSDAAERVLRKNAELYERLS